jgi:hypothetical protein
MMRYLAAGSVPIGYDLEAIRAFGCRPVEGDLLSEGPLIRHDPGKVAAALLHEQDAAAAAETRAAETLAWARATGPTGAGGA